MHFKSLQAYFHNIIFFYIRSRKKSLLFCGMQVMINSLSFVKTYHKCAQANKTVVMKYLTNYTLVFCVAANAHALIVYTPGACSTV